MAKCMVKLTGDKHYKQLTLAQSLSGGGSVRSVAIMKDRGDAEQNAGDNDNRINEVAVSIVEPFGATSEPESGSGAESDDSEPDPDSSDEWLPSVSVRDSSPHLRGSSRAGRHYGSTEPGSSGVPTPTPTESAKSKVPESSRGRASNRGRASSRHGEEDSGWHEGDWQPNRFPFTATPGPAS